jgi:NAD(P)-dependent dehydrogenase (short-subunit alcohol dehydrogenase family)
MSASPNTTSLQGISPGSQVAKCLLFGSSGAIGEAIAGRLRQAGAEVWGVTRAAADATTQRVEWDPLQEPFAVPNALAEQGPFGAVCWAQGMNLNDSIRDFDPDAHRRLYDANVLFVMTSLRALLGADLLERGARLCIVSSIWQDIARPNKLSYSVTKSALHGLVLSLVSDLAQEGHLINAVLPGAVDTPMTRANLTSRQVADIEKATGYGRLATLSDVANTVHFLCSSANTGLTGQFVKVDLGFSDVRVI